MLYCLRHLNLLKEVPSSFAIKSQKTPSPAAKRRDLSPKYGGEV
jgi:hypothetical protein